MKVNNFDGGGATKVHSLYSWEENDWYLDWLCTQIALDPLNFQWQGMQKAFLSFKILHVFPDSKFYGGVACAKEIWSG